jgi:NAD(P)-dependent dehydrogenase (short-subunit alcohol dehydrogenase family)
VTTGLRGDYAGRCVLVTGGAQGVGAAAARRLAEWGAAGVAICDRDAEKGAACAAALRELGARALFVSADLADPDAPGRVIAACDAAFGRLDGLVNAAASTARGGLMDATAASIDAMHAVNLRAPLLLMQGAAALMRRERIAGAMVNIVSVNAHCGAENLAVYSASKGALATLTRNAANTLLRDRIRVNGIMLGWAETPSEHVVQRAESPHGEDWLAHASAGLPFGRLIDVEELADLIAFLLSRHAGVMTGALIDYDQRVQGAP